ncbi:MAG: EscU/YscU/HrcU family type III secretion system export apparatus switch protein [Desulfobacterium sp.]|nr:EscU/YscU/HrcU family type III secretion system export apparatus switch protein [Desulfobacterium sp.]MBU3948926.1 EscU/YscU/HrcU family type III secretion system export apparatus switch protein [Pseudomonadota bacterium]MBU4035954.1 EscU/YscU/HrcU family type III secretion system export apparatus switch protein [Pseudomonadota bacterium]
MTSKKGSNKAVALRYTPEREHAPRVVATGKGTVAEKILQIAKEHNIHIHNDPDLVEMLSQLQPDQEIPPELYKIVAEILVFVYSLTGKKKFG